MLRKFTACNRLEVFEARDQNIIVGLTLKFSNQMKVLLHLTKILCEITILLERKKRDLHEHGRLVEHAVREIFLASASFQK
jgi:hypothetical protein